MLNLRTFVLISLVAMIAAQASLKAKINQRGVDFLMGIAEQFSVGFSMDGMFLKEEFHNVSVRTNISSLTLTAFDVGQAVMDQVPTSNNAYIMNMKNSMMGFTTEYVIERIIKHEKTPLKFGGSLGFLYPNVSAHVEVQLNDDKKKGVTFSLLECEAIVEDDATHISTSSTLTENSTKLLGHAINNVLEKHVKNETCKTLVSKTLIETINNFTTSIPGSLSSFMGIAIDLGLYSNPTVKDHSLEVELDGKCYPVDNPDVSYSYVRHPLPALKTSTKMAQVAIGQYFLETLLDTAVSVGLLKFDVDPSILTLQGTTLDINFISLIVPDILGFMAGKSLGFHVELVEPPVINIGPSQLNASGNVDFALVARLPNGTFTQDPADTAVVFIINANVSGNIWINEDKISGSLSKLDMFLSVKSKSDRIGSVNTQLINLFLPQIVPTALLPWVNDLLAAGIEIPQLFGYKFENANVELLEHAGVLSFDLAQVVSGNHSSGDDPASALQ